MHTFFSQSIIRVGSFRISVRIDFGMDVHRVKKNAFLIFLYYYLLLLFVMNKKIEKINQNAHSEYSFRNLFDHVYSYTLQNYSPYRYPNYPKMFIFIL